MDLWAEVRARAAELDARYEAIGKAWLDSGIPTYVLQTPDWQSGWQVLLDWLDRTLPGF